MANFSSFFPAPATGGGGFTKMNKYVTLRSLLDATHFEGSDNNVLRVHNVQQSGSSVSVGSNEVTFYGNSPSDGAFNVFVNRIDLLVGKTFTRRNTDGNSDGQVYTITSIGPRSNANASQAVQFTPSLTVSLPLNGYCDMDLSFGHTVNPANDLGLSDGDSIGYFMVGGAFKRASSTYGAMGGKIIQGTAIISNASTDLILTPGDGKQGGSYASSAAPGESTISGGLTITSADGHSRSGSAGRQGAMAPGYGINGYGQGAVPYGDSPDTQMVHDLPYHGFGSAVSTTASRFASDGAILIFY